MQDAKYCPEGWHIGLRHRGHLVARMGSIFQLNAGGRADGPHEARLAGGVVGARLLLISS